jgi:putative spermidine/putrescine transport system permease protein
MKTQQGTLPMRFWNGLFNLYGAAVLLFLVIPVLIIVPLSFNAGSFMC